MTVAEHQGSTATDMARAAPDRLWLFTLAVVAIFTAGRIALAATLDLRTDEAYYWTWSQEMVPSYLDHPPMVAWFVRLGTAIFGDNVWGARALHVLAMALIEMVFADIVRRRTGSVAAGLLVVLALESTLNFGVTSAIIEPGIPLVLFAGLMFWALCRLEETADGRWWLLVGLTGGLCLLSKYTTVFLLPAIAAYVLVPPRNRRWLGSGWFWGAGVIGLAMFAPVLYWNWANDWASFRFQGVRAEAGAGIDWNTFSTYFLTNLVFNGPLLAVVTVWGAVVALWRFRRGSDPIGLALALGFLAPFVYLAERSLSLYANPSWTIQMWPFGFAALAIAAYPAGGRTRPWLRRLAFAGAMIGLPITGAMLFHGTIDRNVWLGARDPFGGDAGFDTGADALLATAGAHGAKWIATTDYNTYAVLRWRLRGKITVVQVNERSRFIGFATPDPAVFSAPGLYVHRWEANRLVEEATPGDNRPLAHVERVWRGEVMGPFHVQLIEGWIPDLTPPPDSPFYRWPNLT